MEPWHYILAIVGSFAAGVINTLAGNGSTITLTILIEFLGLPGNLANGTNRVGILAQGITGTWAFHRNGKLPYAKTWKYMFPIFLGAIAGVITATQISSEGFVMVFRVLLVGMLFVILAKPKRWLKPEEFTFNLPAPISFLMFLVLGFYGGFIQMGMGIFLLAALVLLARFNMVEANAIKLFVVLVYTVAIIAIFEYKGLIDWYIGMIFAIGQALGGWITAHYFSRMKNAERFAYWFLVLIVIGTLFEGYPFLNNLCFLTAQKAAKTPLENF